MSNPPLKAVKNYPFLCDIKKNKIFNGKSSLIMQLDENNVVVIDLQNAEELQLIKKKSNYIF